MTLHWWMHWFWVTLLFLIASSDCFAAPQSEEPQHAPTDIEVNRPSKRESRAMYYPKALQITSPPTPAPNATATTPQNQTDPPPTVSQTLLPPQNTTDNATETVWTLINSTEMNTPLPNVTKINANDTVPFANLTETQNATTPYKRRNLTRPDYIKEESSIDGVAESNIVTQKSLSLETTYLQTRIPPNIESSRRVIDPGDSGMDTGAIAGISFAAVVLVALAGSTAFVLYRRRYLNKPQTLNDKCSNPDSSGYLDDSTVRDNSEEMYSLDNDSFLNSLEAMTIQNYWTDTVKHTKL